MFKRFILFPIFVGTLLLSSCVEDDLNFPDDEPVELSESTAIYSYLNQLSKSRTTDSLCLELLFPITLGYSNDLVVEIESMEGLAEAAKGQNSGIHVTGISYPILISSEGTLQSIENEAEFILALHACDLNTLREDFYTNHLQCYEIAYPINIRTTADDTITIDSRQEFVTFTENQANRYQPKFIYPITLNVFENDRQLAIQNIYELYQVINSCGGCPELSFVTEDKHDNLYEFTANFEAIDRLIFDWYVDNTFIKTGGPDDRQLFKVLEPGMHEVCIKATTDDCAQGIEYCEVLEVEDDDPCPELEFEQLYLGNNAYKFTADFEGIDSLGWYGWYIDGELVEEEGINNNGDNILERTFEAGEYEVCIKTETDRCPGGAFYCETVIGKCLPLSYTAVREGGGYVFTADFEGRDNVTYIWSVYINDDYQGGEVREPRSGDDHNFFWQFEAGVLYEICLKQDGECLDEQVCENFQIE